MQPVVKTPARKYKIPAEHTITQGNSENPERKWPGEQSWGGKKFGKKMGKNARLIYVFFSHTAERLLSKISTTTKKKKNNKKKPRRRGKRQREKNFRAGGKSGGKGAGRTRNTQFGATNCGRTWRKVWSRGNPGPRTLWQQWFPAKPAGCGDTVGSCRVRWHFGLYLRNRASPARGTCTIVIRTFRGFQKCIEVWGSEKKKRLQHLSFAYGHPLHYSVRLLPA